MKITIAALVLGLILCAVATRAQAAAGERSAPGKFRVYFGTYTRANASKGIYVAQIDLAGGQLTPAELAGEVTNPSFLALHPSRPLLYAAGEVGDFAGGKGGAVSAFAIDAATGKLQLLNQKSSRGAGPCHLAVDRTGRSVITVNYGSGSVACLPIQDDGQLGEAVGFDQHQGHSVNAKRQQGPHAHSVNIDPANRFAFVCDLGLDKIFCYRLDPAKATLALNTTPWTAIAPGSGPRHFTFHPNGRYAYVINELASTVTAFAYDASKGTLATLETISTLPKDFSGENTCAEVQIHPSGKFLYGSNRGHDSIAIFAIDESTGKLTALGNQSTQGKTPRNFGIDPTGAYLLAANQATNNVVVFRIDPRTGSLQPTGQSISVGSPVCVKFARM